MSPIRFGLLLGLLAAVESAVPVRAQTIPPSAYAALRWRLIGPHRGGRVLAVAGVPGDPATFYFGAVDGGVWRTRNAGVTWEPLFDDQPIASVGALAVAPSDPSIIYVGTGEASLRSDITYGAGVYKSTDGGAHWQSLGLADTRHIGRILVDPRNPDVVLVAALGHAYGPNAERGVFRSTDGGRTWKSVLYQGPDIGAIDLAADPDDPLVAYAALYQARRTPWEQYPPDEGPGSGLYKSTDGGATWTPLSEHGLPAGPLGRIGLAVGHDRRVYALIGATTGAGLYRSDDGGVTWQLAGTDPRITNRNWYFCRVTVDPHNSDIVYVPNVALLKSTDGGKTFTALKGQPGGDDYHELWVDPRSPGRMIVGSDQGAVVSLDSGRTWSSWFNQPTAQFYHVVTDDAFPISRVWRPAGRGHRGGGEPKRFRGNHVPRLGSRGGRRERLHRPRPARSRRRVRRGHLWRGASLRPSHGSVAGHLALARVHVRRADAAAQVSVHLDVAARVRPRRPARALPGCTDGAANH